MPKWVKVFVLAMGALLLICLLLRGFNLVRPYQVPTGSMSPALDPGDHVFMEGLSYLWRDPVRGELVVFRTRNVLPHDQHHVMRAVGLPGERIRLSDGAVFVDGTQVVLENTDGPIKYRYPQGSLALATVAEDQEVTVPEGHYFLLGDNSTNSNDSRFWGFVPHGDVLGRITTRYWPPARRGSVE